MCTRPECTVTNLAPHLLHRLVALTSQFVKGSLKDAAILLDPLYKFNGIHFASYIPAGTCTVLTLMHR